MIHSFSSAVYGAFVLKYTSKSHPLLWSYLPLFQRTLSEAKLTSSKILVGLSGGVDSSVTALVLQALGCDVAALFMKNWDEDDGTDYCTAKQDLADAQAVADQLGIKLHTANFAAEYWDSVFESFLSSYQAGFTPNPDVLCNREIKFEVFREYATLLGFDAIATGHYALMKKSALGPQLVQSVDQNKDQTYFLNGVRREQLQNVLFPLGCIKKSVVRALAEEAGLATTRKKDSTGICFIGERRFKDFLSQYLPAQPGDICNDAGEVLGQHQGLMYYTLGQRKGIGIGGIAAADERPWYVARKCLKSNRLFIVQDSEHPWLMSKSAQLSSINWISHVQTFCAPGENWTGFARCRHRQALVPVELSASEMLSETPLFTFPTPQWAVTPGQYLVLYHEGICLGGGPIGFDPTNQSS